MFGGRSKPAAEGFCDADLGGQKHCHSISGYSFHIQLRTAKAHLFFRPIVLASETVQ